MWHLGDHYYDGKWSFSEGNNLSHEYCKKSSDLKNLYERTVAKPCLIQRMNSENGPSYGMTIVSITNEMISECDYYYLGLWQFYGKRL